MQKRQPIANGEEAETLAIRAVGYLASQDEAFLRFVQLTGAGLDDVRGRLGDPAFLAAVLDFILADEPLLLAFVAAIDAPPETVYAARRHLPGLTPE